ncbi:MAG: PSD1 and planctomycete cytochrome C domain-containing protein [Planctomycetota bacterium]
MFGVSNQMMHLPANATIYLSALLLTGVLACATAAQSQPSDDDAYFDEHIAPLLIRRCVECHQGTDPAGGLDLTSQAGLAQGGDLGEAIDSIKLIESHLLERVVSGEMPPEQQGKSQALPAAEQTELRRWILAGAPWPENRTLDYFEKTNEVRAGRDWWSLQPIDRPDPPLKAESIHPIDSFVQNRLDQHNLEPAPKADRRTLVRRLYYDLLGIPPSYEQVESFAADKDPRAWEKLIDNLLASPQYGQRWARYWLDVARYADTSGYERDQEKPFAWKYRDWVVDALNNDMPYDQFIVQQLAGDEIEDADLSSVIATGFLRLGTWNDEPNDPQDYQYDRLEDLVHTTSSAFLGLTIKCARCHDHKFDAITQEDYYRFASAFWSGPIQSVRKNLGGPSEEQLGYKEVLGWTDIVAKPKALFLLKNGERKQPMFAVQPASISSIPDLEAKFASPPSGSKTTSLRLQLANWLTHRDNPLTTRVIVNRVWQHHFGKGIVRTPNNFGFMADPPTHPLLLDWLASEFLSSGQSLKSLHRLILTSDTWQQSSLHPEQASYEQIDAGNRYWWRFERQRLDAEALRDSMLQASGELSLEPNGPGFKASIPAAALEGLSRKASVWQASPENEQLRRSIYMYLKRGLLPPMMTTFDLCDPTLSCGKRDDTVVPTQALALLNNSFVHRRSRRLAIKIQDSKQADSSDSTDSYREVRQAWKLVLSRPPTEHEKELGLQHLQMQQELIQKQQHAEATGQETIKSNPILHLVPNRYKGREQTSLDGSAAGTFENVAKDPFWVFQDDATARPTFSSASIGGQPALRFSGNGQYLKIQGKLLDSPECTIICVAKDESGNGNRELISNWNGAAGNSTQSLFLGLTGENTIRFSDAAPQAGLLRKRDQAFILSATNGTEKSQVHQNSQLLYSGSAIQNRRLDTDWVIGTQGNIGGEYWKGLIAEILVFDRALPSEQRRAIEQELGERYRIETQAATAEQVDSPELLALASLCQVLMNSNEFLYVD